jgi:hypothetical protein
MTRILLSDSRASALRTLLRAAVVCSTAFGLKLSAEQVAAVQLATEAVIQAARAWATKAV